MIKKLQRRFTRIALLSLTAAMVLVVLVVNLSNWISVRQELMGTLTLIAGSGGVPDAAMPGDEPQPPVPDGTVPQLPERTASPVSEETASAVPEPPESGEGMPGERETERAFNPWEWNRWSRRARNLARESRWFSVRESADGELTPQSQQLWETSGEDSRLELARQALDSGRTEAFLGDYLYVVRTTDAGRTVTFLNGETRIAAARTLALISAAACVGGILLAWLLVALASRKAVEPTLRNMEAQKRFITDASHELKTPLSVISASMELLQTEIPGNQWVRRTQKQTAVMRRLVDELVFLSRMEEENPTLEIVPLQVRPLLRETAEPFAAMAEFQGRELEVEAEDGLWINGDRDSVSRMFSTLFDNAVKYAAGQGKILVSARADGRQIAVSFSNEVSEPLSKEQCDRMFDRFYRTDPSRSKEKKEGFGIGLAIAAAVAENHGGSISAVMEDNRLVITCLLPKGQPPERKK